MSTQSVQPESLPDETYLETIQNVQLPDQVLEVVEEYEAVGGERDRFVWKWIYTLFPSFTLSSVPHRHFQTVRTTKTIFTVFITLLDDLAEKTNDPQTFNHIYRSVVWPDEPPSNYPESNLAIVEFADHLWTSIEQRLTNAPRYAEFNDVFRYDLRQAINAMDYSRMVNDRLSMANLNGVTHYDSHNMVMFPYADMDIMSSPAFNPMDLGILREQIWDLQKMARIGNWLTTWEREINEGDYTAGVIVYALQNGLISRNDLQEAGPEAKAAITNRIKTYEVEKLFLAEWEHLHRKVTERDLEAASVDLDAFVDGMKTVMEHHLASEGLK